MENNDLNYCYYSDLPSPLAYATEDNSKKELTVLQIDRIIEMAWEDRTPFDAIEYQFGLKEDDVKILMRNNLRIKSYKLWRKRVGDSNTKHAAKRNNNISRFKSKLQRLITGNKISKR